MLTTLASPLINKHMSTYAPKGLPAGALKFSRQHKPVEIVDREVKRLKQSWIAIVKFHWKSERGPEFTWEREDQIKKKYPHLFTSKDKAMRVYETS
ncbi:hypothetical protein Tco_1203896 [Tanacetum coccineum]